MMVCDDEEWKSEEEMFDRMNTLFVNTIVCFQCESFNHIQMKDNDIHNAHIVPYVSMLLYMKLT